MYWLALPTASAHRSDRLFGLPLEAIVHNDCGGQYCRLVMITSGFVAEIVWLIDYRQTESAPIKHCQVDTICFSWNPWQIGVVQNCISKVVLHKWVAFLTELCWVKFPVFTEFLRVKHQYSLVLRLIVADDRQRRISFSKSYAVGEDITVVLY